MYILGVEYVSIINLAIYESISRTNNGEIVKDRILLLLQKYIKEGSPRKNYIYDSTIPHYNIRYKCTYIS